MRRDVFQGLSDPVRRHIIELLSAEELRLSDISAVFTISRPAISRHIKILKECGLVNVKVKGRERYCELDAGNLKEAYSWLAAFRNSWSSPESEEEKGGKKKKKNKKQKKGKK